MRESVLVTALVTFIAACGQVEGPSAPADAAPAMSGPLPADGPGAAAATAGNTPEALLIGDWVLVAIDDEPIPDGKGSPTLNVVPGAITGFAGVNRYQSAPARDLATLFGPLATTRMAGPPAAMELESRFLAALGAATDAYVLEENQVLVLQSEDQPDLRFRRAGAAP